MTSDRRLRTRRQQLHDPTATNYRARRVNSGGSASSIDASFFTHLPLPTPYTLSSDTTYSRPKSHARKRSPDHVPRPRNAFILFRCDFVRQKVVPEEYERDHCNLSRIAGAVWNVMSKSDKAPWIDLAQLEKKEHAERYPHLRRSKGSKGGKPMPTPEDDEERGRSRSRQDTPSSFPDTPLFAFEDNPYTYSTAHGFSPIPDAQPVPHTALTYTLPGRRSSSCPPPDSEPASITPSAPVEYGPGHTVAAAIIDPPVRRPSSVMLFHSIQPTESVFHGEWHAPKAVAYEHAKATMDVYDSNHVPNAAADYSQGSAQSYAFPWTSTYTTPTIDDDYSPFGYSPTSPMSVDGAEYYYSGSNGVYEPPMPLPQPESYTNWYQEPPTFTNPFAPSARPPPTMYHEVSVSPYDVFPPSRP